MLAAESEDRVSANSSFLKAIQNARNTEIDDFEQLFDLGIEESSNVEKDIPEPVKDDNKTDIPKDETDKKVDQDIPKDGDDENEAPPVAATEEGQTDSEVPADNEPPQVAAESALADDEKTLPTDNAEETPAQVEKASDASLENNIPQQDEEASKIETQNEHNQAVEEKENDIDFLKVIQFDMNDVERSELVKYILKLYTN